VQLESFVAEVGGLRASGKASPELEAVGGGFLRAMTSEGWYERGVLAPGDAALRTMYKQMWNSFLGLEHRPEFEPSLDEWRAAYAFYLLHARPAKPMRAALAAARRGAGDAKACREIAEHERLAVEASRVQRIKNLAAIDPAYPADYALGVASYRHGDYAVAADAFRRWLQTHPDGPLALRARNHLRAAAQAEGAD